MRTFFLFLGLLISSAALFAQTPVCNPDPDVVDTTGVFPLLYDPLLMDGGIETSACIGQPYAFIFTVANAAPINFGGSPITLNYIQLPIDGSAFSGMPIGLEYACDPPNCTFNTGTIGCVLIYGTAAALNTPGTYPLTVNLTVSSFLGITPTTIPGLLFSGQYELVLEENGSTTCFVGTDDATFAQELKIVPQPFENSTAIEFNVIEPGDFTIKVFDMTGRLVDYRALNLGIGQQSVNIDATNWSQGIYTFAILKENQRMTGKLVRL
jgi:Secretion system C-terminal sorting domain